VQLKLQKDHHRQAVRRDQPETTQQGRRLDLVEASPHSGLAADLRQQAQPDLPQLAQ
jgi:hypothetical protein